MSTKKDIVIVNEDGGLLLNKSGQVLVFNTKEDAIKCVDDGGTYENIEYRGITEAIVTADKEVFDINKVYWS